MYYIDYLNVEDWKILDTKICRFFNDEETPFEAFQVEIGTKTTYSNDVKGKAVDKTAVIRWISRAQYENLKKNSGVIIF